MTTTATIDLKQLRYFAGVVDAGSMTRAAEQLGIAQPALSNRIMRLEAEIGVRLLNRSPRGVFPTDEGFALYAAANRILRDLEGVADEVRNLGRMPTGRVFFGCLHSSANLLGAPFVERVMRDLPGVQLTFFSSQSIDVYRRLLAGELDMGFIFKDTDVPGVTGAPVLREELFFAVSPQADPFPGQDRVEVEDLFQVGLLMAAPSLFSTRRVIERAFADHGGVIRVAAEVDSLSIIIELIGRGGASVLPWSAVPDARRGSVVLKRIGAHGLMRTLELCRPTDRSLTVGGEAVSQAALRVVRDLVETGVWGGVSLA